MYLKNKKISNLTYQYTQRLTLRTDPSIKTHKSHTNQSLNPSSTHITPQQPPNRKRQHGPAKLPPPCTLNVPAEQTPRGIFSPHQSYAQREKDTHRTSEPDLAIVVIQFAINPRFCLIFSAEDQVFAPTPRPPRVVILGAVQTARVFVVQNWIVDTASALAGEIICLREQMPPYLSGRLRRVVPGSF